MMILQKILEKGFILFMTEINLQSIKQVNRNRVFRLIAARQRISKQEIAAELKLSLPTTTQNLNSLKDEGLIEENGTFSSGIGRKARAVSIVADFRVAVGLDITPHHISLVLVDLNGSMMDHVREKFEIADSELCYGQLAEKVRNLIDKNKIRPEQILGMGITIPGIIAFDKKTITSAETCRYLRISVRFFKNILIFRVCYLMMPAVPEWRNSGKMIMKIRPLPICS